MKKTIAILAITSLTLLAQEGDEQAAPNDAANTIVLDEISVKNLGIELVEAVEIDFEETLFSIGRIAEIPTSHAVVSSRIPGRVIEVNAIAGDQVTQGQVLVRVESLQPGDPPPTVALVAPISGMVLESHVRIGEPVEPAQELLDVVDLRVVWAIARVPEQEAGRIKIGSKARIRIAAHPGEVYDGELIRFGTQADVTSGTIEAIFMLKNRDSHLRPGMRAEFSIITESRSNVLAVPSEAVQGDPTNRVVYVEHFDLPNTYIKTPVQTGKHNDRHIEIVNGLFPSDRVVTTGSYFLGSAGGGGGSLKEALDAAHGHPHNEDGSLMTEEQKAAEAAAKGIAPGQSKSNGPLTLFLGITSCFLFALLVLSGIKHLRDGRILATTLDSAPPSPPEPPVVGGTAAPSATPVTSLSQSSTPTPDA